MLVRATELEVSWPALTPDERDELADLYDETERELRRERDVLLVYGDRRSEQDRMAGAMWAREVGCDLDDGADPITEGLAHVAAWRERLACVSG